MKCCANIEWNLSKRKKFIREVIRKNRTPKNGEPKQTLLLVPEKHMLAAYQDIGTLFHAGLKQSEKKNIASGTASGEIKVIIGTQKALFLPYKNLRTIMIDEEQYESYKLWNQYPRLHTVRGAHELARTTDADIVHMCSYASIALRYVIEQGTCKILHNHPIALATTIIPFSFEDRKWKRAVPDEASRAIRTWARRGLSVLVLYNKKDAALVRDAITKHITSSAKNNIHIGTSALVTSSRTKNIDRVVWLFPEFSMRAYDFRAEERSRIMAARLQCITPKHKLLIATRHTDHARGAFESSEDAWYRATIEERQRLYLPPFSDLVRLTIRDTNDTKAKQRATRVREMLDSAFESSSQCRALGPFQEYGAKAKKTHEYHLLLAGPLDVLSNIYHDLPVDIVDVDPHKII